VRLSLDDFCGLAPDEFEAVCKAYHDQREFDYRNGWEQARMVATICIQPHVKNKITPNRLLPFAWDNKRKTADRSKQTAEERQQRMKDAIAKFGEKY